MAKTLESFGYHASLIIDNDYLVGALQTNLRDKNGFLEIRQKGIIPIYKIENQEIKAIAVMGVKPESIEEIVNSIKREDIIKSIVAINRDKNTFRVAFYNKNQPIDHMLKFCYLKVPVKLDDLFFIDIINISDN